MDYWLSTISFLLRPAVCRQNSPFLQVILRCVMLIRYKSFFVLKDKPFVRFLAENFIKDVPFVQNMIDRTDMRILNILKRSSNLSVREIARETGLTRSTVSSRIFKLKKEGVIRNFTVTINYKAIVKPVTAYVGVNIDYPYCKENKIKHSVISEKLLRHEMVESADVITGGKDIIVKIRAKDIDDVNEFINHLRMSEGIDKTESFIVLYEPIPAIKFATKNR